MTNLSNETKVINAIASTIDSLYPDYPIVTSRTDNGVVAPRFYLFITQTRLIERITNAGFVFEYSIELTFDSGDDGKDLLEEVREPLLLALRRTGEYRPINIRSNRLEDEGVLQFTFTINAPLRDLDEVERIEAVENNARVKYE